MRGGQGCHAGCMLCRQLLEPLNLFSHHCITGAEAQNQCQVSRLKLQKHLLRLTSDAVNQSFSIAKLVLSKYYLSNNCNANRLDLRACCSATGSCLLVTCLLPLVDC